MKKNPIEKMLYFSQTFKTLYVSIHTTYPANFIEDLIKSTAKTDTFV